MVVVLTQHDTLGVIPVLSSRRRPLFLPPLVRECVCFAYVREGKKLRPVGTVFFGSVSMGEMEMSAPVLVTAMHLVAGAKRLREEGRGDGLLHVRVNTVDGGSNVVSVGYDAWAIPDQSDGLVDVAMCPLPFDRESLRYLTVSSDTWLTDEIIEKDSGWLLRGRFAGVHKQQAGKRFWLASLLRLGHY